MAGLDGLKNNLRQLNSALNASAASGAQLTTVEDPNSKLYATRLSLRPNKYIVLGLIVDVTLVASVYKVSVEGGLGQQIAVLSSDTSYGVYGARALSTLTVGTLVVCIYDQNESFLTIVGALPSPALTESAPQVSILHGASRARVDDAHKLPLRLNPDSPIPIMTGGKPYDAAGGGEAGWITETGMRIFIDPFMTMVGLDESSNLSFFYHDAMVRLTALQYQMWTSVSEHESLNDQEEALEWTGHATYPWENMGMFARSGFVQVNSAQEWQKDKPWLSKVDLANQFAMPWHRVREWFGYLGQGGKKLLIAPPPIVTEDGDAGESGKTDRENGPTAARYSAYKNVEAELTAYPGLAEQFTTLDGRMCFHSAKGLSFVKHAIISAPARKAKPESPTGDKPSNYKFSGVLGDGPEHKITGDLKSNSDYPQLEQIAGLLDLHGYIYNYAGNHPFYYHKEDYDLPEESEAEWADGVSTAIPDFTKLKEDFYLSPEPFKKELTIDHRYSKQNYYTLSAGIEILPDGNVVIFNGFGSEIKLVGGDIVLSTPGNIWQKSGKNINHWAGNDYVMRARNSADFSVTEKDIRIKAEQNLMMTAGNSGTGGVLIEALGKHAPLDFKEAGQAAELSGIVLKCLDSQHTVWANGCYISTQDKPIVLDANQGRSDIVTYGKELINFVRDKAYFHFNTALNTVTGPSTELSAVAARFPGQVTAASGILVQGGLDVNGGLRVIGEASGTQGPAWNLLLPDAVRGIDNAISEAVRVSTTTIPTESGQPYMTNTMVVSFYSEGFAGYRDTVRSVGVAFRSQDDYRALGLVIYDDRWQSMGRQSEQDLLSWVEKPLTVNGVTSYPYPGKFAYDEGSFALQSQTFTIYSPSTEHNKDRGVEELDPVYADPQFGERQSLGLNQYLVIG